VAPSPVKAFRDPLRYYKWSEVPRARITNEGCPAQVLLLRIRWLRTVHPNQLVRRGIIILKSLFSTLNKPVYLIGSEARRYGHVNVTHLNTTAVPKVGSSTLYSQYQHGSWVLCSAFPMICKAQEHTEGVPHWSKPEYSSQLILGPAPAH